jgi:hypothetical protein
VTGHTRRVSEVVQRVVYHRLLNEQQGETEQRDHSDPKRQLETKRSSESDAIVDSFVCRDHIKLNLLLNKQGCKTFASIAVPVNLIHSYSPSKPLLKT